MRTKYKHIEMKPEGNTWKVVNTQKKQVLGTIGYYNRWKQFCFVPAANTIFSASCLGDLQEFIVQLIEQPLVDTLKQNE